MLLEIDILNASVAALIPITITGVFVGISKVAEFNEHKKSVADWMVDANKKMDTHETNDENRQKEVLSRMESMERNILENWKQLIQNK